MTQPLLSAEDVAALRGALELASYTVDAVNQAIGAEGEAGLARNHTIAAERALTDRDDNLATLIRLFVLQQAVPDALAQSALPVRGLSPAGMLVSHEGQTRATLDIRPYAADDGVAGWVVSDHAASLNTRPSMPKPDFVLGISPASTTLAQLTIRDRVGAALDLGTGCGVQVLHLAQHVNQITATDLNPRALELAHLTLALSGARADLRLGSLYEPVAGQQYDLITTNPPFVMSPTTHERLVYREGSYEADGLMRAVVTDGAKHLAPGGTLQVLGNWVHLAGQPWEDRLAGWIEPTGCDAVVIQREVLDPYEYIEIWLTDAGLAGTPDYLPRYREWLDYFGRLEVEAIGMGWVTLRNEGRSQPAVSLEHWPHLVAQPVGSAIAQQLHAVDLARMSNDELLIQRWVLAPDTIEESYGDPGAQDPTHIVLRRQQGLCRAIEVDTALGGVLGVCDGELPLWQVVRAVASLTDVDEPALRAEILPRFRELVGHGWLTPVASGEDHR